MKERTILEPAREVEVIHQTDVLVVCSGPGGLAAALAAARTGVEVTLVERFGYCAVTGQGAGIAAALTLKSNAELDGVSIVEIQKELTRQGVRYA